MQYSEDLTTKYATLIIDGYRLEDDVTGIVYDGYKETQQLMGAIGGQWYTEYNVDSGLLGVSYPERTGGLYTSGKMQARVEIGRTLDNDGYVINPEFVSNVTLVDMIITRTANVAEFIYTPYNPTGSIYKISLHSDYIYEAGLTSSEDVQSYRIFLYDSNRNLIKDSGELYDWDTNVYGNAWYTLYDLKDNTTYYVKGRVTLNGGTSFYTEFTPINVHYDDIPISSDKFTLSQSLGEVKMSLDLTGVTHTKVVFSRTVFNESDYLELTKVEGNEDTMVAYDKFPIPKKSYTYKAVVFNGDLIVDTYYQNINFTSQYVTISDILGSYSAVGNITKHPINRNDRGAIVAAMDSQYPYYIVNGSSDYDSGQIDGFFSTIDDECKVETDNAAYADFLRAWLNNGNAKLLTYYTGEAWIVSVNGVSTTDPNNDDVYNTSFNWTAIGDANIMSEYVRLGLVINE